MADIDERALIERCRAGDDRAFGELVDGYRAIVYGLVYRMIADRSQVDDLAQEVFIRVYRGLPYFRGDSKLATWIYRIVANVCSQARSRRPAEVSLEPVRDDAVAREPASVDRAFSEFETRDRLEKALAQLPDNYRMLVAAHYLHGVQYEALAEALDVPLGTIKTHLHRAKRRLRELLT